MDDALAHPSPDLSGMLKPVARVGLIVAVVFLGGFSAWSGLAPLSSAAIAPGVVSPDTSRKTIQHLEGGIVQEILVREGDKVREGDILIRLSPVQARTSYQAQQHQWQRLAAERVRLEALKIELDALVWPDALTEVEDAEFRAFLANQNALFVAQRQTLSEKQSILDRRAEQILAEIDAISRQNAGIAEQLQIINEEIADKETLAEQGLLRKPELLLLKRQRADLDARMAANEAGIARARQQIEEVAVARVSVQTERTDMIARDLARIGSEIAPLEEAIAASRDVFQRTEIAAPVSGTVLNLKTRTTGGIVRPGEPILDIVPSRDALIIEAHLSPNDIDVVTIGQEARIHLLPYAARNAPPLQGRLAHIDPDSTVNEVTGERYFEIRVEVDPHQLERLAADIRLTPGMPTEVFITTGEQSLLNYLAAPIARSFRRAFREE